MSRTRVCCGRWCTRITGRTNLRNCVGPQRVAPSSLLHDVLIILSALLRKTFEKTNVDENDSGPIIFCCDGSFSGWESWGGRWVGDRTYPWGVRVAPMIDAASCGQLRRRRRCSQLRRRRRSCLVDAASCGGADAGTSRPGPGRRGRLPPARPTPGGRFGGPSSARCRIRRCLCALMLPQRHLRTKRAFGDRCTIRCLH